MSEANHLTSKQYKIDLLSIEEINISYPVTFIRKVTQSCYDQEQADIF
jgi:hypothetical protein